MNKIDTQALQLCVDTALADSDPETRRQVIDKLADRRRWGTWQETAEFCAFHCQIRSLNLKPWQKPPCIADRDGHDDPADVLLRKMLDAGVSRYHPDPLWALEAADEV